MPRQRTAYDIMGLPRNATTSQIRGRFRRLAQHAKPHLEIPSLLQDRDFAPILQAYALLMSPQRKDYDRELREARGQPVPMPNLAPKPGECEALALAAEIALFRRQFALSLQYAKEAASLAPRHAPCWALLAEVMKQQGRYAEAASMYNYAIQMDPDNSQYWHLLNEVTALRNGTRPRRGGSHLGKGENLSATAWAGLLAVFVLIEVSLFWVYGRPGPPLLWGIGRNLVLLAGLDGLFLGLALARGGLLGRFGDELVHYRVPTLGGRGWVPVGAWGAVPGLVCFWAAPICYALVAWQDAYRSRGLVLVMVCSALIAGSLVAMHPHPLPNTLLVGNFVFLGMLLGWLIGSVRVRRPRHK